MLATREPQDHFTVSDAKPWPDRPIRLGLVITDLDTGGAERAMVNLATRVNRRRWAPKVFAIAGEGDLARVLRAEDIPFECLGCKRHQPIRALTRLALALRKFQPGIVQSFLFHANLASRLVTPLAGWPPVVSGIRVAERDKRWHLVLDRLTARLGAAHVCVSKGVLHFSQEVGKLDPRRLTVIPNGIDPAPFDEAGAIPRPALGIPEESRLALFVGRLDRQKGLPDLLDAAERVAVACPAWHLVLAGDGPYRQWLVEQVDARRPLSGRVHILGRRDDVPSLLKTSDVLVLPSLWEGMPNVVLEAMAASKPVIATTVEGTDELVVPGETGWLVPPGDPLALGAALIAAASDPEQSTTFGLNGRSRVASRFSLEQTVAAYERLWSRLLGYQPG